jgi:hypothetical protein
MRDITNIASAKYARRRMADARLDALMASEQMDDPATTLQQQQLTVANIGLTRRIDDVAALQELFLAKADRTESRWWRGWWGGLLAGLALSVVLVGLTAAVLG